jgi:hypothetical protein
MEKENTLAIELLGNLPVDVGCLKEPIPVSSIPTYGTMLTSSSNSRSTDVEFKQQLI